MEIPRLKSFCGGSVDMSREFHLRWEEMHGIGNAWLAKSTSRAAFSRPCQPVLAVFCKRAPKKRIVRAKTPVLSSILRPHGAFLSRRIPLAGGPPSISTAFPQTKNRSERARFVANLSRPLAK